MSEQEGRGGDWTEERGRSDEGTSDEGTSDEGTSDEGTSRQEGGPDASGEHSLAAERDRLARTLRDTRLQLAMTQARLTALEGSATMNLGRTLVRAARRPWSRGVQLPLDLIRMWRERGGVTGPGAASLALASAQLSDLSGVGERFLSALTAPGLGAPAAASAGFSPPGLVVTGVLSAESCATLAPDTAVFPLLPHDADVVLESVGADLVLIEAAAMLAGSAWAYAGDPAATDRGRRLGRLIAGARALGKPVIFIRNVPAHLAPGLDWVAASCDAAWDGGFGVQLARFNPIGVAGQRPSDPVYAGARDPREPPAVRALLDWLTGEGGGSGPVPLTGETAWRWRPALYREHALFVTVDPGQAREQLACGARVIMVTGDRAALRGQIAAARAERPLTEGEAFGELREIFTAHATPVRLAELARLAGLPEHLVTGRQIAVLARVQDAADAADLAGRLHRQRMTPAELVVAVAAREGVPAATSCHAVTTALADLAGPGMTITAVPEPPAAAGVATGAAGPGGGWVAHAAQAARSPWVVPWPTGRDHQESYLLDLACARECARADAVGYDAGAGYAYVTSLDPALARREFFSPDGPCHGLRLFSLS